MYPMLRRALRLWLAIFAVYALLIQAVVPAYASGGPVPTGFEICHDGSNAPVDHARVHGIFCCTLCAPQHVALPAGEFVAVVALPGPAAAYFKPVLDTAVIPAEPDFRLPPPRAPPLLS